MTPEQIEILISALSLMAKISGWPFAVMLFIFMIGPWLLSVLLSLQSRRRLEVVIKMYEDNVDLVKKYERTSEDLKDVVIMNTQAVTRLVDYIRGSGR